MNHYLSVIYIYVVTASFAIASQAMEKNEFDKIEEALYQQATNRINDASTKEGKNRLFLKFEKEFSIVKLIPIENTKDKHYRLLLWKYFLCDIELAKLIMEDCRIIRRVTEINLAFKESNDKNNLIEEIISLANYTLSNMSENIKRKKIIVDDMVSIESEIITKYGPQKK